VTNDLERRVIEHRNGLIDGFTKKYKCHNLVYFENGGNINEAIAREKQIKKYSRVKKEELIFSTNPSWSDLSIL